MISRTTVRILQQAAASSRSVRPSASYFSSAFRSRTQKNIIVSAPRHCRAVKLCAFHTSPAQFAQAPTADALMEDLNELYATAKDEFEIAAEETEKKTVYAADDREAAQDALKQLQDGFEKAIKQSSPEVAKEVQSRVGQRIRELENAVKAMEEMAMED